MTENLKEYDVEVIESYKRVVQVLAHSEAEAKARAEDGWKNCEFILTKNDFYGTEFNIIGQGRETDREPGDFVIDGFGDSEAYQDE